MPTVRMTVTVTYTETHDVELTGEEFAQLRGKPPEVCGDIVLAGTILWDGRGECIDSSTDDIDVTGWTALPDKEAKVKP